MNEADAPPAKTGERRRFPAFWSREHHVRAIKTVIVAHYRKAL